MVQNKKNSKTATLTTTTSWLVPVLIALFIATLINKLAVYWFHFNWTTVLNFVNYFGVYALASVLTKKYDARRCHATSGAQKHPAYDWPLPRPIGKYGKFAPLLTYYPSQLLSLLNPFLFIQQIKLLFGQILLNKRLREDSNYFEVFQSATHYRLPFKGEWLIYHGGHTPATSHSWDIVTQRFAYDFVKADQSYCRHASLGGQLEQYYCYGEEILAAADGEVVKVVDGLRDGIGIGYFIVDFLAKDLAGNHVIIKHAEGEYGFYAHLLRNSILPMVGDKVKQGQTVGRCGFSGNGTEPHLHFHLQDGVSFYQSLGLPISFTDTYVNGSFVKGNSKLVRGSRVKN